jgi:pimeloyl-ACP methyl ester carboxylesterase
MNCASVHKSILAVILVGRVIFSANITDPAGGGTLSILEEKSVYRDVDAYSGTGVTPMRLHCRFFRYSELTGPMPLLVMCVEWGGTIASTEQRTQFEEFGDDPFVTLVFMPETVDGDISNPSNWYWGNAWTDGDGNKWSVPWCHTAVVDFLNEIKSGVLDLNSVFAGLEIDTNRIYGFGHSIGGTATDQICIKHPEIFAAFHGHAGWTKYWGQDNTFFSDTRGCLIFADLIGGIDVGSGADRHCEIDSSVMIMGNADQTRLPLSDQAYHAFQYTDLGWYFGKTGDTWNYRDPSFPTPYIFFTNGDNDNPENQGDPLQPSLELSQRGYSYYRASGGHTAGQVLVRWNRLRNFRKDQSYLAFTARDYGNNDLSQVGDFNPLDVRGWDHTTIEDEPGRYYVQLTGSGTSDVTLRRLQNLQHHPGTVYDVTINGQAAGQVAADEFGLVTIPGVADDAALELSVTGASGTRAGWQMYSPCFRLVQEPFHAQVRMTFSQRISSAVLNVYTPAGMLCKTYSIINRDHYGLDTEELLPGMYLLQVITSSGSSINKIVSIP